MKAVRMQKQGTLMELWNSGARMPFIVQHPDSGQTAVVHSYYWPRGFFAAEINGVLVGLTAEWALWAFVREA